jgi:hypothetical protein
MIQSASILPITERLSWGRAVPPGDTLTPVSASGPVDVVAYRNRDQELAYRDLIVASLIAKVAVGIGDVWQFATARPQIPAAVAGELIYSGADAPAGASPAGPVTHVNNASIPLDAAYVDQQLYARDIVLYEALRRTAEVLEDVPLTALAPTLTASEAWSLADGVQRTLASVGFNLPLNVDLFRQPDTDLAGRDNQLAAFIARLQLAMADVFSRATRLYVRAPGREAEVYALVTATATERLWKAYPLLPTGRLQIRYDVATKTVVWLGEEPVAANPVPQALTVPVAGGNLSVVASVPARPDSEFYRQKAARLLTRPYADRVIFQTGSPQLYVVSGGLYQPDSILLTNPTTAGNAVFSLPLLVPPGCVRVGVHLVLSRYLTVLGFLNRTRVADGTAVTLTAAGTIYYDLPLPAGRLRMSLELTDKTAATPAFDVEVTAGSNLAFDGAFTFNQAPGTAVTTQEFELDVTTPGTVTIAIRWLGGAGQLTLNQLNLVTAADPDASTTYSVGVALGAYQPSPSLTLSGVPERPDVVWFDTLVPDTDPAPLLGFTWSGGGGLALYISGYDLRVFDPKAALPDAAGYEPHKATLAAAALDRARDAYAAALAAGFTDPRTPDDTYGYVWDATANNAWLTAMLTNGEPRLLNAFQAAGPGDVGRPALVPPGLIPAARGEVVVASLPVAQLAPSFVALQAWMLPFRPRVAGPDFWPMSEAACASLGASLTAISTTADFSWALELPVTGQTYISAMTAVSRIYGSPDGAEFVAYTIPNAGPGGGALAQTVDLVVGVVNAVLNVTYTITLDTLVEPVDESSPGTSDAIVVTFQATATTMEVAVPTITATSGYKVTVLSATLS